MATKKSAKSATQAKASSSKSAKSAKSATSAKSAKSTKSKRSKSAKSSAEAALGMQLSIEVVEIDPASFPDDIKQHALELVPLVRDLRMLASQQPKRIHVGPPTTRDRVEALAEHYKSKLLPDYTALAMLADGMRVQNSCELYSIEELVSPKLTKSTKKLREVYGGCLPIGNISGGWLYVMPHAVGPYRADIGSTTVQRASVKELVEQMLSDVMPLGSS